MTLAVFAHPRTIRMETVDEYHASGFWASRRDEYVRDHPHAACFCGRTDIQLHHLDYLHLGEEPDRDLLPVCPDHHYEVEKHIRSSSLDRAAATREYVEAWRSRQERTVADGPRRLNVMAAFRAGESA